MAVLDADPDFVPVLWCAFGPPCMNVYFPIVLAGDLPMPPGKGTYSLGGSLPAHVRAQMQRISPRREAWTRARAGLGELQGHFDQETSAFSAEAAMLKKRGEGGELLRQATFFMQHTLEQFDKLIEQLQTTGARLPASIPAGSRG
jgi:hypothetical protein